MSFSKTELLLLKVCNSQQGMLNALQLQIYELAQKVDLDDEGELKTQFDRFFEFYKTNNETLTELFDLMGPPDAR